jgi:hypothetical protein
VRGEKPAALDADVPVARSVDDERRDSDRRDDVADVYQTVHARVRGGGVLATFDGPARGVRCACAIADEIRPLGIEVRAGLHTGECEVIGVAGRLDLGILTSERVIGSAPADRSCGTAPYMSYC